MAVSFHPRVYGCLVESANVRLEQHSCQGETQLFVSFKVSLEGDFCEFNSPGIDEQVCRHEVTEGSGFEIHRRAVIQAVTRGPNDGCQMRNGLKPKVTTMRTFQQRGLSRRQFLLGAGAVPFARPALAFVSRGAPAFMAPFHELATAGRKRVKIRDVQVMVHGGDSGRSRRLHEAT